MSIFDKLKKGELVECMTFENDGRVLRRDQKFKKVGPIIYDDFVGEAYACVTRPFLNIKGRKSGPVYMIDRDSACTVELRRQPAEDGAEEDRITIPETPQQHQEETRLGGILGKILGKTPDHLVIENPQEIVIDGRRFAGWTAEIRRSKQVMEITTNPELIGRALRSSLFSEAFGVKAEMRQVVIGALIGLLIGTFLIGPAL